jgi:hypothetical protein
MVFESSITITFTPCNGFGSANYFTLLDAATVAVAPIGFRTCRVQVCHGPSELTRA